MCFGMVLIMSVYNSALHGFSSFTVESAIFQFVITSIVAFIDVTFVEPKAQKPELLIPYDNSKEFNFIVAIAFCMVPITVLVMSVFGLILTLFVTGIQRTIFLTYVKLI